MWLQNPANLELPADCFGGGLILPYLDKRPAVGARVFLAPGSAVIGETTLEDDVSIWFGAVLRGDIAPVSVGAGSNIQDQSVLHVGDDDPCIVGRQVVVGHRATLHGCSVEDGCLIGMGAIVLNGAVIGRDSVVGAGALVTQGMQIPPRNLVLGSPAKVKRELTPEELAHHQGYAAKYVRVAANYRAQFTPPTC